MRDENMISLHDFWPGHHATLIYDEIKDAGPIAQPLDFPTPRVHRCVSVSVQALDHRTGAVHLVHHVLIPSLEGSRRRQSERAYLVKKKLAKSTFGSIRLCCVLRRRSDVERAGLHEVEWESTDQLVVVKASSWARIRQCRGKHLEDPLKEVASLQYTGNYHPHILGCQEAFQDDDYLYVVMPYCSGGDLYAKIMGRKPQPTEQQPVRPSRPSDEAQARIWFWQLLQALFHLQKKGVCHRDLSLDNLLLDQNNDLVVVDFGVSLRVPYTDSSNYGNICDVSEGASRLLMRSQGQGGNFTYMAPELVARDEAFDGFAVDLWSCGVILFIMLVGLAPFRWAQVSDIRFDQINSGQLREMVRHMGFPISDSACHLLQNMFWRDPNKRLTLAQVMTHRWVTNGDEMIPAPAPAMKIPGSKTEYTLLYNQRKPKSQMAVLPESRDSSPRRNRLGTIVEEQIESRSNLAGEECKSPLSSQRKRLPLGTASGSPGSEQQSRADLTAPAR